MMWIRKNKKKCGILRGLARELQALWPIYIQLSNCLARDLKMKKLFASAKKNENTVRCNSLWKTQKEEIFKTINSFVPILYCLANAALFDNWKVQYYSCTDDGSVYIIIMIIISIVIKKDTRHTHIHYSNYSRWE